MTVITALREWFTGLRVVGKNYGHMKRELGAARLEIARLRGHDLDLARLGVLDAAMDLRAAEQRVADAKEALKELGP